MLVKRVTKWLAKFKKYFFYYRDGFFELPYLYNSPNLMIQSLKAMPFNKYNAKTDTIKTQTPFLDSTLHFHEIEKGLWMMMVEIDFKANICFKVIFDEDDIEEFYTLSYYISSSVFKKHPHLVVNDIEFSTKTWGFFKPKQLIDAYCFKHTHALYYNIYVSKEWVEKNIFATQKSISLQTFLQSAQNYISIPDLKDPHVANPFLSLYGTFNNKHTKESINHLQLKIEVLNLIANFYDALGTFNYSENQLPLNAGNRKLMQKAERILLDNLFVAFPGIENMADELGISPTKLKNDFKLVYGQTLFNYYQQHRMHYANEMLKRQKLKIKDLAKNLGYENVSKFTAAFKKQFGYLPSDADRDL